MIQIIDDPSAERTAPPRSTHVRSGDVSSFLIQQGGGEVDGDPAARRRGGGNSGISAGLRQAQTGGRGVTGGREAPGLGVLLPCTSPLYIGVEGAGFLPSKSIGAGGPSRWTPGPLRWSRYTTGDARNTFGGQNHTSYISIFTSGPFRNSS